MQESQIGPEYDATARRGFGEEASPEPAQRGAGDDV
jgi:hypothetical protein